MSWYMNAWIVYTIAISAYALMAHANDRDERKTSEYYRDKWLEAQSRRRA